jgi:hypothetical protein
MSEDLAGWLCFPLASGAALRRRLPSSLVPRSSVQAAPRPLRLGQTNALRPVIARPTISVLISRVPS